MNDAIAWKELVWDVAVKAAITLVFTAIGMPWLGTLLAPIVTMFTDKLFQVMSTFVVVEKIRIENEEHRRAFEAASIRLRQAAKDGVGSEAYRKAREDAQAALVQFVRFGAN